MYFIILRLRCSHIRFLRPHPRINFITTDNEHSIYKNEHFDRNCNFFMNIYEHFLNCKIYLTYFNKIGKIEHRLAFANISKRTGCLVSEQKKILIVEDNINFANDLATNFEAGGFDTLYTDNIEVATRIQCDNEIDGISLDIQLKGSLGINLLDKIYSGDLRLGTIPVIIVVSSFINPQILRVLKKHRVLH